jgi:hypothetical protein
MHTSRSKFLIVPALLAACVFSFLFVAPVYADDGTTPEPTAAAVVTETPTVMATPTAEPTVVSTETPAPSETPTLEATTSTEPTEPALVDVVNALAENDVQLVDGAGEGLSLTRQNTSDLVTDGDPYFSVGSVKYRFLRTGTGSCGSDPYCFVSDTPIQAALDYMQANSLTPTDRKLYIEAGTYTDEVNVDGSVAGVNGLTGLLGLGSTPNDVRINGTIYVHNMAAGFQISNLTVNNSEFIATAALRTESITGSVTITDVVTTATTTNSSGMEITAIGNIILNRVTSNNNAGIGAYAASGGGSITVMNSTFDNNLNDFNPSTIHRALAGLLIYGQYPGNVTIKGVSAQGNSGSGLLLYKGGKITTVADSIFNDNHDLANNPMSGYGIYLYQAPSLTLSNVTTSRNDEGIFVSSSGPFMGTQIMSENNDGYGLEIKCSIWNESEGICKNDEIQNIKISDSSFNQNGNSGIKLTVNGLITMNEIDSMGNGGPGLYLDNYSSKSSAGITLTDVKALGNSYGIAAFSKGPITATNINASYNYYDGIYVINYGSSPTIITISPVDPLDFNVTAHNGGNGYTIQSMGPVSITSLDSYENGGKGGFIDNTYAPAYASSVTINVLDPKASYNSYESNGGSGLTINSHGRVALSDINASYNHGDGAYINNRPATDIAGQAVVINNSSFSYNCVLDVDGNCAFGDRGYIGLHVDTNGSITLLNVTADSNDGWGTYLESDYTGAAGAVTINAGIGKINSFSNNYGSGLVVYTNGAITTTNLRALENGWFGVDLHNLNFITPASVTMNAGTGMWNDISGNGGAGVLIQTTGAVTITNITADRNQRYYGLGIDNASGSAAVIIKQVVSGNTFKGNTFNGNNDLGLTIGSKGNVTVTFYQANDNTGSGITIYVDEGNGIVALSGMANQFENVSRNGEHGLFIRTKNNISATNIVANDNGNWGAMISNSAGAGNITLTSAYFDGNGQGVNLVTTNAVVWKNGSANDNHWKGVDINNSFGSIGKPVTISNVIANDNGLSGFTIISKGAVVLTNVGASDNSINDEIMAYGDSWVDNLTADQNWTFAGKNGDHVTVEIASGNFTPSVQILDANGNLVGSADGAAGTVALTVNLTANGNYTILVTSAEGISQAYSIDLYSAAKVKGSGSARVSMANGINIDNLGSTNAPVMISNSQVMQTSNNDLDNIHIQSNGLVTIVGMEMNDSHHTGLDINNRYSPGSMGVILTNVSFNNNDAHGANIQTRGAVKVQNGAAEGNDMYGFVIENYYGPVITPITLTNVTATGNSQMGMSLHTLGSATLTNINSSYNGECGIMLSAPAGVTFTNVSASHNNERGALVLTNGPFTINKVAGSYNQFSDNGATGLDAGSGVKSTLTGVIANDNTGTGIRISNGNAPIVMTDIHVENNSQDGLYAYSTSTVTLTSITALENDQMGLDINQAGASINTILLSKVDATGNGSTGIYVLGVGKVTLGKFVANDNGNMGVFVDNSAGAGTVTILNPAGGSTNNQASGNGGNGVSITTNGAVTVTGLEVVENGRDGLDVNNNGTLVTPVTLNAVFSRNNGWNGINVTSKGVVTVNSSWIAGNGMTGMGVTTPGNTFVNNTTSINNQNNGLSFWLLPTGNLTLTNSFWFGNVRSGAPIPNLYFSGGTLTIH